MISAASSTDNISYYYTSQLTMNNITQHLNGSTIVCVCDQQFLNGSQVNIQLTTGTTLVFSLLSNNVYRLFLFAYITASMLDAIHINLSKVTTGHLSFHWNPTLMNCQFVRYVIRSSDCSNCSEVSTTSNSIICNVSLCLLFKQQYTLSVQPIVCNEVHGERSNLEMELMKGWSQQLSQSLSHCA